MARDSPTQQVATRASNRGEAVLLYAIHAATLCTLLFFASRPVGRTWGLSAWAHLPEWVSVVAFSAALLAPLFFVRLAARLEGRSRSLFLPASTVLATGLAIGFVMLRAKTHFLGDGYQHLARMAAARPHPKSTSLGEDWIHIAARHIFGGDPASAALHAYQALSVVAGVLFVLLTLRFAASFFSTTSQRLVFSLCLTCTGPMLLFFGYVESYSFFAVSVLATSLVAIAILRGLARCGWLVPLLLVTMWLHVLGVLLLPGVLFVFWRSSPWFRAVRSWPRVRRVATVVAAMIVVLPAAIYLLRKHLFLQLAFVPLRPTRFTVEGYTLLSGSHVLDWLNLAFVMLPSLPLLLGAFRRLRFGEVLRSAVYQYLAIALVTTTAASLLLDPKLGMPRDWDLYAPFGVQLSLFAFYLLSERLHDLRWGRLVAAMTIVLGWSVLGARVVEGARPGVALQRFESYLALDKAKSVNARMLLVRYHEHRGDSGAAQGEIDRWNRDYPERGLVRAAHHLRLEGKLDESVALSRRALELNPIFYDAYTNLGACLLARRDFTGAMRMFEISLGLNPGDVFALLSLGEVHYYLGDYAEAETMWLRAHAIDPGIYHVNRSLAGLYARLGRHEKHNEFRRAAAASPDAPEDSASGAGTGSGL